MSILFLISILLVLLQPFGYSHVEAIKCYVCQSNVDPKCADPFDNLTLPITDCEAYPRADLASRLDQDPNEGKSGSIFSVFSGGLSSSSVEPIQATFCRKIRQKVNGEWRTIRECGYLATSQDSFDGSMNSCRMRSGTYDVIMESCICDNKDGCNSAQGQSEISGLKLTLIPLVSSYIFYRSFFTN